MGDVFKEQIIKRKPNMTDRLKRAGITAAALFIVFLFISLPVLQGFMMFGVLGVGVGVYFAFSYLNLEYEYIFTNGDLDIDCIYGRTRRKRVFSGDVKSDAVELMVHHTERGYDSQFKKATIKRDCGSGALNDSSYRLLCRYKGKFMDLTIEPNETMFAALTPYLGMRKLIKKR